ncbi:MAG: ribosome silencing factor [Christensenellaceae bacterium]|jgi:ribosome-associated protein|nr:ribosome silencing factor [Christensenellaceae bacterium]
MLPSELASKVVDVLNDKNAKDVEVIDISQKTIIADYFIIATANNVPHCKALSDHVEEKLSENEILPIRKEGHQDGRWCILDYGSIIVHIFIPTERKFFDLEKLWS